jgi:hypothetical protein
MHTPASFPRNLLLSGCLLAACTGFAQLGTPFDLTLPREAISDIETADLNGDGFQDVVVIHDDRAQGNYVVWYAGDGAGGFAEAQPIASVFPSDIEIADINGDGHADIVFAAAAARRIGWLANDGTGQFGPLIVVADSLTGVQKATPFDLDGDGDLDLIALVDDPNFVDTQSAVVWYENDGSGGFVTGRTVFRGNLKDPWDVEAGDMDGDGDPDLVIACLNTDDVTWFENLGGALSWSGKNVLTTALIGCRELELGDLDGDGDLDIVVASVGTQRVAWLRNNGAGAFSLLSLSAFGGSTVDDAMDVHLFDANGDGLLDVAAALLDENAIDLFINQGGGSFSPAQRVTDRSFFASAVAAADLDGDGDLDLISGSQSDAKLAWYENLGGAGVFGPNRFINEAAGGVSALAAADLNGDGRPDVLSVSTLDQKLAWYENLGGLNFSRQRILDQSAIQHKDLVALDLDGDGDIDLALIGREVLLILINDGAAQFSSSVAFSGFNDARAIRAADLDGDGLPDLVVTSWFDSQLSWFRNLGGGSFGPRQLIASLGGAHGLTLSDWDGDGWIDIAAASEFNDEFYLYRNLGGGSFAAPVLLASSLNGLFSLESRDVNGDGLEDILYAAYFANSVGYVPNLGGGVFGPRVTVSNSLNGAYRIDTWDPQGSGLPELLVPVYFQNRTVSIENLGGGSFGTRRTVFSAFEYHRIALGVDLDGDGDEDLLLGFKNSVTVVPNLRLSPAVCTTGSAPSGLSAEVLPTGVRLSWDPIPGSVACQVQGRPTGAAGFAALPPLSGPEPDEALVPGSALLPGTTYEWRVRCACSLSPLALSPFSALSSFVVPALRTDLGGAGLSLYPNPAGENLHISWQQAEAGPVRLLVFDASGRTVSERALLSPQGLQTLSLDTRNWPPGIYSVHYQSRDLTHSSLIQIQP